MNQKEMNGIARFFVQSLKPGLYEDIVSMNLRNPTYSDILNTFHNKSKRDKFILVIP